MCQESRREMESYCFTASVKASTSWFSISWVSDLISLASLESVNAGYWSSYLLRAWLAFRLSGEQRRYECLTGIVTELFTYTEVTQKSLEEIVLGRVLQQVGLNAVRSDLGERKCWWEGEEKVA